MSWVDFHYIKTGTGELSGPSFVDQTEQTINELGDYFENVEGTANSALSQAQTAQQTANAAQQTANSAVSQAQNAQASADAAQQAADQAQTTADNALEAAQNAGDEAGTKAPIMHASDATTYGVGSSALYGHVQLSDATNGTQSAGTGGTAATPYAVAQAMTAAQTAQQTADAAQQVGQTAQQTANASLAAAQAAQNAAQTAQQTADAAQSALDQSVENINTQLLNLSQMQDFAVTSTAIDVTAYAGTFSRLYLTSDASASTGLPTGISYPCFFWTLRTKGSDNAFMFVLSNNVLYSQSGENTTPDGDTPTWSFTGWQKITYAAATTSALGVVKADGTTVEVASDGTLSINTNLLSQVYKFKGSVATVDDLPTGAAQGDVYNVTATDANYAWTGSAWDNIGGIAAVDASPVQSSTNPVSSGGVYSALENLQSGLEGQISTAGAQPSTSTPLVAGTAEVGKQTAYARGDHRHPAQTSVSGNAGTATKLATKRTIDGVSFDGSAAITHYGTCSTAAATAEKVVDLSGFSLATGARITVRFTVTNKASNPTLNVNGTGAKAIQYRNAAISAGYLAANRVYEFVYDSSAWELVGDIDTNTTYSVASQAEAEAGTNNKKMMTPLRVKQAIAELSPVKSVNGANADENGNVLVSIFKGMIIAYSGTFSDKHPEVDGHVYTDWAICDGTNGTPNLINTFIRGTNASGIGSTGGADSQTVNMSGSVSVTGLTVDPHTLTIAEMPNHSHSYSRYDSFHEDGKYQTSSVGISAQTGSTGGSSAHTHSISGQGNKTFTASGSVNTVPKYYALAYIMKIQ